MTSAPRPMPQADRFHNRWPLQPFRIPITVLRAPAQPYVSMPRRASRRARRWFSWTDRPFNEVVVVARHLAANRRIGQPEGLVVGAQETRVNVERDGLLLAGDVGEVAPVVGAVRGRPRPPRLGRIIDPEFRDQHLARRDDVPTELRK